MNDAQVGSVFRAVRIRRGLTQAALAQTAEISRAVVSSIERGRLEHVSHRSLRALARSLGMSATIDVHWRGAETAKLLDERHAALVREVARELTALGWLVRPEYTFNVFGERGSIDVLAWHPHEGAVLAVEVKTRLVDLQDLLSTTDRKARLLETICRNEGWRPDAWGSILVLPEESWARHAVRQYAPIFDAAFPARTVEARRWLRKPAGRLRAIWFLSIANNGSKKRKPRSAYRVRPAAGRSKSAESGPNRGESAP